MTTSNNVTRLTFPRQPNSIETEITAVQCVAPGEFEITLATATDCKTITMSTAALIGAVKLAVAAINADLPSTLDAVGLP
jgi:hypothetical protein